MAAAQAAPLLSQNGHMPKAASRGASRRGSRRFSSIDDLDLMRFSSSGFGWYDEGATESEDLKSSFIQHDNWREVQTMSTQPSTIAHIDPAEATLDDGTAAETGAVSSETAGRVDGSIEFELGAAMTVTTRTFTRPNGASVPYAVAIRAFRVINGHGGHAQVSACKLQMERTVAHSMVYKNMILIELRFALFFCADDSILNHVAFHPLVLCC